MSLIEQYYKDGLVKVDLDYRTGSLRELVSSASPTVDSIAPTFSRDSGEMCRVFGGPPAPGNLNYGVVAGAAIPDLTKPFTWIWAVRPSRPAAAANRIVFSNRDAATGYGWGLFFYQQKWNFVLIGTSTSVQVDTPVITPSSRPNIMRYDGSKTAAGVKFYVEGSNVTTATVANTWGANGSVPNTGSLVAGGHYTSGFVGGNYLYFKFIDRYLTDTDVAQVYDELNTGRLRKAVYSFPRRQGLVPTLQGKTEPILAYDFKTKDSAGKLVNLGTAGSAYNSTITKANDQPEGMHFLGATPASYIDVPGTGAGSIVDFTTQPFTVEVVVLTEPATNVGKEIVAKTNQATLGWEIIRSNNNLYATARNTAVPYAQSDYTVSSGCFVHVTAVYSGSTVTMYLNGIKQAAVGNYTSIGSSSHLLSFARWSGGSYYNQGSYRMAKIYDRALSADEVKNNYKAIASATDQVVDLAAIPSSTASITTSGFLPGSKIARILSSYTGYVSDYLTKDLSGSPVRHTILQKGGPASGFYWVDSKSYMRAWQFSFKVVAGAMSFSVGVSTVDGYSVSAYTNGEVRITAGGAIIFQSAPGVISTGVEYSCYFGFFAESNTWKVYMKGGAFASWTLVGSVQNTTYTDMKYIYLYQYNQGTGDYIGGVKGSKILCYAMAIDPNLIDE